MARSNGPPLEVDVFRELVSGSPPYSEFNSLILLEGPNVARFLSGAGVRHLSKSLQYGRLLFEGTREDRILVAGEGTVETATCMFHHDINLKRYAAAANELGIKMNAELDALFFAHAHLIVLNGMHERITHNGKEIKTAYGRPCTHSLDGYFIGLPGDGKSIVSNIIIPFPSYDASIDASKGLVLVFSEDMRPRGNLPSPNLKEAMNYVWAAVLKNFWDKEYPKWVEAHQEWKTRYPRMNEVLFATREGNVAEGSVDNIAFVRKVGSRTVITTPKSGCLPGFTMQVIGLIAKEHGIAFERSNLSVRELFEDNSIAAVFITGNAMGAAPVDFIANPEMRLRSGVKGREFDSSQNPVVKFLIAEYNRLLSTNDAYRKWDMWMDLRDILTPKQFAYLEDVRRYMLAKKSLNAPTIVRTELGDMAIRADIMMRLNSAMLRPTKNALARLEDHKKAHEKLQLVYK